MINISRELIFAETKNSKILRAFNFADHNFCKILKQKKQELWLIFYILISYFYFFTITSHMIFYNSTNKFPSSFS